MKKEGIGDYDILIEQDGHCVIVKESYTLSICNYMFYLFLFWQNTHLRLSNGARLSDVSQ